MSRIITLTRNKNRIFIMMCLLSSLATVMAFSLNSFIVPFLIGIAEVILLIQIQREFGKIKMSEAFINSVDYKDLEEELHNIVDNLSEKSQLNIAPTPTVSIFESREINAMAFNYYGDSYGVAITTGLIQELKKTAHKLRTAISQNTDYNHALHQFCYNMKWRVNSFSHNFFSYYWLQKHKVDNFFHLTLEGIIAHELGHIKFHDLTSIKYLQFCGSGVYGLYFATTLFSLMKNFNFTGYWQYTDYLYHFTKFILRPLNTCLIRLYIQNGEFLADYAAKIVNKQQGMINFLTMIMQKELSSKFDVNDIIVNENSNALEPKLLLKVFSTYFIDFAIDIAICHFLPTHPSNTSRIEHLKKPATPCLAARNNL